MTSFNRLALAGTVFITLGACNGDANGANSTAPATTTAAPVPAPANGDWSTVVAATPEGGFAMGNPAAKVKLIEYGSMTCPACAAFDETVLPTLIDKYVKQGQVSFEFRNYVRDPFDITASLVARCGGPSSFFGLTRAMYADQKNWMAKIQAADPAQMQALQTQGPQQQFKALADLAGFTSFAAMRGLPKARSEACLADPAAATQLVQMNSDAVSNFEVAGTPTIIINGTKSDAPPTLAGLEPAIQAALGS